MPAMPSVAPTGLPALGGGTKPPMPATAPPITPTPGKPAPNPTQVNGPDTRGSSAKAKPSILFLLLDLLVFGGSVAGCVLLFINY
jgi:hypothetical protein